MHLTLENLWYFIQKPLGPELIYHYLDYPDHSPISWTTQDDHYGQVFTTLPRTTRGNWAVRVGQEMTR